MAHVVGDGVGRSDDGLLQITEEEVVVLLNEAVNRVSHIASVVFQPKLVALDGLLHLVIPLGVAQIVRVFG